MKVNWQGVYPAATTQFEQDESLNLARTQQVVDGLIRDGVDGIITLGTVGENCSLSPAEKRQVVSAVVEAVDGRVPVIAGTAEATTAEACRYVGDVSELGVSGCMVLPGMVYRSTDEEAVYHFSQVASANPDVPLMIYNNPVSYGVDVKLEMMEQLATFENIVAIKESTTDTRRITELYSRFDERFIVYCGVDDIALESIMLGATGWISGLTNAFPTESVALFKLAKAGRYEEAKALYRWFLPLLRLDTIPTLVQCIKLAEQVCGRGTEWVRAPRLPLQGAERARVTALVETALATRPQLPGF
ncbi:dihydrodipicolinate synthase family protein [Pokkaliibacter sp. CJK22405]|uniref:dihydrodipicolinate synthase family protein n=1 Tax=Pokkaliibacter sp. CJK22405 TaxID=3384615 RepID=UPI003984CD50